MAFTPGRDYFPLRAHHIEGSTEPSDFLGSPYETRPKDHLDYYDHEDTVLVRATPSPNDWYVSLGEKGDYSRLYCISSTLAELARRTIVTANMHYVRRAPTQLRVLGRTATTTTTQLAAEFGEIEFTDYDYTTSEADLMVAHRARIETVPGIDPALGIDRARKIYESILYSVERTH